jgi:hypothetical protein
MPVDPACRLHVILCVEVTFDRNQWKRPSIRDILARTWSMLQRLIEAWRDQCGDRDFRMIKIFEIGMWQLGQWLR